MYLSYNSQKIIPAPWVNFSWEQVRTEDGSKVGKQFVATISGKFLHGKGGLYSGSGYPADDYTKCSLEDLLAKQEELRNLFADDYMWFEIQPDPEVSAPSSKWVAKVRSIEFPEGLWNPICDYTVVLELQTDSWDHIASYDETWDLTENETPRDTFTLTHSIRCSSKEEYVTASSSVTEGWKKAYDYIYNILGGEGIDGSILNNDPGFNLAVSFNEYNHKITRVCDEHNGRYEITETWTMSEEAYAEEQTFTVETDRDAPEGHNTSVTVEGTVTAFKTLAGGGWSNAQSRWTSVEGSLYADVSSYVGVTLRQEPKSKRTVYDQLNRIISYNYVYDEGLTNCDEDITMTVASRSEVPECSVYDVTVEGTIKGIKDATNSAYDNAKTCFAALNIVSLATTAYSDAGVGGTLNTDPYRTTIGYNEFNSTVNFNYTYNDKPNSITHNRTITTRYARDSDITAVTLDGDISADCAGEWSDVTTEWDTITEASARVDCLAEYDGYYSLCTKAVNRSVAKNELGLRTTYSFEFSDDSKCSADVETSVTVKSDPQHCGKQLIDVEGTIVGRRSNTDPWTNAQNEYTANHSEADAKTKASSYVSGTLYRITRSQTYSEETWRINYSYEFSNQSSYTIDETITEKWTGEGDECGYTTTSQEGTVTGLCTNGEGSAYDNAQTGYATVSDPSGAGPQIRNSESRNEHQGTIAYSKEFVNRPNPWKIDLTETTRERLDDCYDVITIEGTVIGLCENNNNSTRWTNAQTGYDSLGTIAPSTAGSWNQISKSVGNNEYGGRITFAYEFKEVNRCVSGAISDSVEISEEMAADIFAVVDVIGGAPVIQDKNGSTVTSKSVNIQVQMPPDCTSCALTGEPDVESIVNDAEPAGAVVLVKQNIKNWHPRTGRFTRQKSWVYGDC